MSLAKQYGADRIWIVNVGHFKGYEFPTEYFLNLAWNTEPLDATSNLREYTRLWAAREFGAGVRCGNRRHHRRVHASSTAAASRSCWTPDTYSLVQSPAKSDRVVAEFATWRRSAEALYEQAARAQARCLLSARAVSSRRRRAQVNEMYVTAAQATRSMRAGPRQHERHGRSCTRDLFKADADLMAHFNKVFAGGKWDHFHGSAAHRLHHVARSAGQQPRRGRLTEIAVPAEAARWVSRSTGRPSAWPGAAEEPVLPGSMPSDSSAISSTCSTGDARRSRLPATTSAPWIMLSETPAAPSTGDARLWVSIDWARRPCRDADSGSVTVSAADRDGDRQGGSVQAGQTSRATALRDGVWRDHRESSRSNRSTSRRNDPIRRREPLDP